MTVYDGSGVFLSTIQIQGLELRLLGLAAGNFNHLVDPMMSCFKTEQMSLKRSFYHFCDSQSGRHLHVSFHLPHDNSDYWAVVSREHTCFYWHYPWKKSVSMPATLTSLVSCRVAQFPERWRCWLDEEGTDKA